jgi:tetrahydromethanopterin S-methyltransferase subunit F
MLFIAKIKKRKNDADDKTIADIRQRDAEIRRSARLTAGVKQKDQLDQSQNPIYYLGRE